MASAVTRVFGVTELLEKILLNLDGPTPPQQKPHSAIEQLFVLQRVNKQFRDVIRGSIILQRQMNLAHDEKGTEQRDSGAEFIITRLKPLMPGVVKCQYKPLNTRHQMSSRQLVMQKVIDLEMPIATSNSRPLDPDKISQQHEDIASVVSSWRAMKLCNRPQATIVHLEMKCLVGSGFIQGKCGVLIAFDGGFETLGDLSDRLSAIHSLSESERYEHGLRCNGLMCLVEDAHNDWAMLNSTIPKSFCVSTAENLGVVRHLKSKHSRLRTCGRHDGSCTICSSEIWMDKAEEEFWAAI